MASLFSYYQIKCFTPNSVCTKIQKADLFYAFLHLPIERTRKNRVCCDAKQRIFQKNVLHETTWYKWETQTFFPWRNKKIWTWLLTGAPRLPSPPEGPGTLELGLLSSGFAEIWGGKSYTTSLSHLITACESLTFCKTPHIYGSIF